MTDFFVLMLAVTFSAIFICITGSFGIIRGNPPIMTLKNNQSINIWIFEINQSINLLTNRPINVWPEFTVADPSISISIHRLYHLLYLLVVYLKTYPWFFCRLYPLRYLISRGRKFHTNYFFMKLVFMVWV